MKPEEILQKMAGHYQNFKINKSRLSGIFKITEQYGLKVDVDQEPESWTVFDSASGDYEYWNNCPEKIRDSAFEFIKAYISLKGEEVKEPLDNLKDSEGLPESQPEEPKWSKPAPKHEKINYDEGLEPANLPALTDVGIVRPVVTAAQALAAWNEFQALKKAIIEDSDKQVIEVYDKRTNTKKKSAFIKKSGWRKLAACFNLTIRSISEVKEPIEAGGFLWTIKVVCRAPNGREMEGVAKCSSVEKTGSRIEHDVYSTAYTRAVNRAISDLIAAGEASAEEMEA